MFRNQTRRKLWNDGPRKKAYAVCGSTQRSGRPGLIRWLSGEKQLRLGLPVSCFPRSAEHIADPAFQQLVAEIPSMALILEHLAGAYGPLSPPSVTAPYAWYKAALTLSRFPNTYIKFGGLVEFCIRPRPLAAQFAFDEVPPLSDLAYEAFGPERMMWGSDYPPVGGREGYRNSLQGVLELPLFKAQEEKDCAFGKTASKAFKLD